MPRNMMKELADLNERLADAEELIRELAAFRTALCVETERWAELCLQAAERMRTTEERVKGRKRR